MERLESRFLYPLKWSGVYHNSWCYPNRQLGLLPVDPEEGRIGVHTLSTQRRRNIR